MSTPTVVAALVVVSLFGMCAPPAFGQTISDDTFDPSDWTLTVIESGTGGSATATQLQSGGNPGAHRSYSNTVNDPSSEEYALIYAYHLHNVATWDPSTQGPLGCVSFSNDIATNGGAQIGHGLVVAQDEYYFHSAYLIYAGGWSTQSASGLASADFEEPFSSMHPDFSASGAPMVFGFVRANSQDAGMPAGYTVTGGTDNWSLTLATGNDTCIWDADSDGDIDGANLALLLGCWGELAGAGQSCVCLDSDSDGDIDSDDLAELLGKWSYDDNGNGVADGCE